MRYLLTMLLAMSLFVACKKKDSSPAVTGGPATTGGTSISTSGSMSTILIRSYSGNMLNSTDSVSSGTFYTGLSSGSPVNVSAGTVRLNNVTFSENAGYQYLDSTHSINIHGVCSWSVSGSASVPAITYSYTPSYPAFTGNAQLPDSISRSSGCTFQLAGISNHIGSEPVIVELLQGSAYVSKQINAGQTSCSFSVGELSSLQSGTDATLLLLLSNSTLQAFGGKQYSFEASLEHLKYNIKIKP